jgi:hypothetical protein
VPVLHSQRATDHRAEHRAGTLSQLHENKTRCQRLDCQPQLPRAHLEDALSQADLVIGREGLRDEGVAYK